MRIQLNTSFSTQQKIIKFNAAIQTATLKGKNAAKHPLCKSYKEELSSSRFISIQY